MNNVRIIAKIEIKGPNLIKGLQFDGFRSLGKAVDYARCYYQEGIDELIYQDVVASLYQRDSLLELIKLSAKHIFIPLTVMGGVRTLEDISKLLAAGADKVGINTHAIMEPHFIKKAAEKFGSQCILGSVEMYQTPDKQYKVWINYGKDPTLVDAAEWCYRLVELGVGELVITSVNRDGMGRGFDVEFIRRIAESVPVPVIACGGAGKLTDFVEVITKGKADAVCAASVFHYHYAPQHIEYFLKNHANEQLDDLEIDKGNFDFYIEGYGGQKAIMVNPISIRAVKAHLLQQTISIRTDS